MEEHLERCCGIDVHKRNLVACVMVSSGKKVKKQIRTFGTMTDDLESLAAWLKGEDIHQIAIESTGIYWKPIFNILESDFEIILANARNVKNVPGRKTDVKDAEWLCKLLKNGLIEKSFIPPEDIRHLRNLTRFRKKTVEGITREKNRIIKLLEDSNIKLSSVLTDVYGKTGWNIIKKIVQGETDPTVLASEIFGRVKASRLDIERALKGKITTYHREMIGLCVHHIEHMEDMIASIDKQVSDVQRPYQAETELLISIPGIKETGAASIIAELGVDMNQFPSKEALSSWSGLSPGSNESAGKKKVPIQHMGINS